jgi:WD40 repeat protein
MLASGGWNDEVWLCDAGTGQLLQTFPGQAVVVSDVAISPDGRLLASSGFHRASHYTAWLWDIGTGNLVQQLDALDVFGIAFSPALPSGASSRAIALVRRDKTLQLWDLGANQLVHTLEEPSSEVVYSIAFSPDGHVFAAGGSSSTVRLWDTSTGELLQVLKGHTDTVTSIIFNSDGHILASGSLDGTIRLWNVSTGQLIHALTGHTGPVYSVSFSPDGRTLASGSLDGTVRLWHVTWP